MKGHTVSINGKITNGEDAKISVFDRGFLFGDSIYDVTISHNRKLLFFNEHLERLFNSAKLIGLEIQRTQSEIIEMCLNTLKKSNIDNAYIRIIITRGEDNIGLSYSDDLKQNIIIIVKEAPIYPKELYTKGIFLLLAETRRNHIDSLDPNAKSGNYLNNILAIQEAKKESAYDSIMENHQGEITEGTTFNIWFVKSGVLYTPHIESGLLQGITRSRVLKFAREASIDVREVKCTKVDLQNADEVFITSSTKGIMPVYKLNSRVFHEVLSEKSLTQKLMHIYSQGVNIHLNETSYKY